MGFDYKQRIATALPNEPIGRLLASLHMESAFYTKSQLSAPWALAMPAMSGCMMFHLVVSGKVSFSSDGHQFELSTGDFVLFPKGQGHRLSDGHCQRFTPLAELPIENITERYETLTFGGNGATSELICGALVFQHPLAIKLLGILPSHIVIDSSSDKPPNVVQTISQLLQLETKQIGVATEAVIARLADILVIESMRAYLNTLSDTETGWLSALDDERIGLSLRLLHEQPTKHWTLEQLANAVGMSRTSFAQQFKRLMGNTPMDYLTEWRMSLAYSKLQLSQDTVLSIALDVGYQSEAAFSRAFKKVIGKNPSEVRKDYQLESQEG
ncbi:AraC family transcriptional regulator [Neiella marina]|uniref:AraC family transcriptional regulator n=1 Tax=Neiella marina TaxID=508461 RepID=A0A8J2U3L3_9GAMM|nr:AraC family transcriptional regulator [Neiella marina]GGA71790.1 AraC family transcriptional regulator [Neiella marina]